MKILILGGTKFVGKEIAKSIILDGKNEINFLNRGISNPSFFKKYKTIFMDRNDSNFFLKEKLFYDLVIDVSCYDIDQLTNVVKNINFEKYIFISSSAVNGVPFLNVSPDMYEMAQYAYKKKKCEDYFINNIRKYLIFRPCYIVGEYDYTDRFYKKDGIYFWKNGLKLDYYIESKDLAKLIIDNIYFENSGIIKPCD
jgi:nucleoside-diphosphate-sugar epimerase